MKRNNVIRLFLIYSMMTSGSAYSHGNEIKVNQTQKSEVINLSPDQTKALDLKTEKPTHQNLNQTLNLKGEVRLLPNSQADVNVRINGQVSELYVTVGDQVKKGQKLAKVVSLVVGDPPPSVEILAPMGGIIDARNVKLGQGVQPNSPLFSISNRDQVIVDAVLYEEDIGKVKLSQKASVNISSYPDKTFTGKVILVGPTLDPDSRTTNLQILLDNPEGLLKPNMSAEAYIIIDENTDALVIPSEAILESGGVRFVFLKEGDRYNRSVVKTKASNDQYTEILKGVRADDNVVIQGQQELFALWLTGGKVQGEE